MSHRLLIVGAGRIGAGYGNWADDGYTHAGAAKALSNRIELVGFVETDIGRAVEAKKKWGVPAWDTMPRAILELEPDVVSVCTPHEHHPVAVEWLTEHSEVEGIWVEKPYRASTFRQAPPWVQVNYLRRADPVHQHVAKNMSGGTVKVAGKDDLTTRCHFDDLAAWWSAKLEYTPFDGPCSYLYEPPYAGSHMWFPMGGIQPDLCMKGMLGNLLDAMEGKSYLWSPPR